MTKKRKGEERIYGPHSTKANNPEYQGEGEISREDKNAWYRLMEFNERSALIEQENRIKENKHDN